VVAILYFFACKLSGQDIPDATPLATERMAAVTDISEYTKDVRRENAELKKAAQDQSNDALRALAAAAVNDLSDYETSEEEDFSVYDDEQ
jgi:hypothetical protein